MRTVPGSGRLVVNARDEALQRVLQCILADNGYADEPTGDVWDEFAQRLTKDRPEEHGGAGVVGLAQLFGGAGGGQSAADDDDAVFATAHVLFLPDRCGNVLPSPSLPTDRLGG